MSSWNICCTFMCSNHQNGAQIKIWDHKSMYLSHAEYFVNYSMNQSKLSFTEAFPMFKNMESCIFKH